MSKESMKAAILENLKKHEAAGDERAIRATKVMLKGFYEAFPEENGK